MIDNNSILENKLQKVLPFLYILLVIAFTYAVIIDFPLLEHIFNPLSGICLFFYYNCSVKNKNQWYVIALLLGVFGDFFYSSGNLIFTIGAFIIINLIYVKIIIDSMKDVSLKKFITPAFFYLFFLLMIIWLIKENLNELVALEVIYGVIISSLGVLSFINVSEKTNKSNIYLFLGFFLLIITSVFVGLYDLFHNKIIFDIMISVLHSAAQFIICIGMIKKNQPKKINSEKIAIGLYLILTILTLAFISLKENQYAEILPPISIFVLMVAYWRYAREKKLTILLFLICIFLSKCILIYNQHELYFNDISYFLIASELILCYEIYKLKHIKLLGAVKYFIIVFGAYLFMYYYMLNEEFRSYEILVFCVVNSSLTAIALENYIKKMYMANYLLWIGVAFGVLNLAISFTDILNVKLNVYASVTNFVSVYLISRSFIIRVSK